MIPKMPDEYKGKTNKSGGYTTSSPRVWTDKELEWIKVMMKNGYTAKEIAESVDRTHTSVAIKIKRLGKKEGSYNSSHIDEKYKINQEFLDYIKPKSVLDLYCGEKDFYKDYPRITNDINNNINTSNHYDALHLLCNLYWENKNFDLIDLDPFGSAYDCFDLAIKMANKGLVITLGEMGHKRWKRLDYVSRYYGINNLDDFTSDNLIKHIQRLGLKNKKKLIVFKKCDWKNTSRVWFIIEPIKITEQRKEK